MFGAKVIFQSRAGKVPLGRVPRQEREDNQARGCDAEREALAFEENEGTDREADVLAQHADSFVAASGRQEGALAGLFSKGPDGVAGQFGDVIPLRCDRPHEEELGPQVAAARLGIKVQEPFDRQR